MDHENNFVLLSSCKNEAEYIRQCIESVIGQDRLPLIWVIVDDGSTDETADIIREFADQSNFIELFQIESGRKRSFGSKDKAINRAYKSIKEKDFNYIGILDTDITLESNSYFSEVLAELDQDTQLAISGGAVYEKKNSVFQPRPVNVPWSVAGCVQMFRRECFDLVGGFTPLDYGGSDTLTELKLRRQGWKTKTIQHLQVNHYRPTSSAGGLIKGSFKAGLLAGSFGSHGLFILIKSLRRLFHKPYIIGSFLMFIGYLHHRLFVRRTLVPPEVTEYLRMEQRSRIRSIIQFKSPTLPGDQK